MKTLTSLALCTVLTASGAAQAALIDRGGGLIYDTDLNIMWSNHFGGAMTWTAAQQWIGAMNASNGGTGYLGYNNWRLPTSDSCLGYNCPGSEMGHLFFNELGGTAYTSISAHHSVSYALFPGLQDQQYWSSTESGSSAYLFYFNLGYSNELNKGSGGIHAWAVRTGDVAAVPVPTAAWLLGSGLLGLMGLVRRKAA